jgi:hypothetical protein
MLAMDAIGVGFIVGGVALAQMDNDANLLGLLPFLAGAIIYLNVGPSMHISHGKRWTARVSYAARFVLPVVGLGVGANVVACPADDSWCRRAKIGSAIGASLGVIAWSAIDAGLLANADVPIVYAAPTNGGATAGVALRF